MKMLILLFLLSYIVIFPKPPASEPSSSVNNLSVSSDSIPLSPGNIWSYRVLHPGSEDHFTNVSVIYDTMLADGFTYSAFTYSPVQPEILYQYMRYDSGNVYYYNITDSSAKLVFDFNAEPGSEWDYSDPYQRPVILRSIDTTTIFGKQTRIFNYALGGIIFTDIWVSPDFGYIRIEDFGDHSGVIPSSTYQLIGCIINDTTYGTLVDVNEVNEIPAEFSLSQNFPNPFNPETHIEFQISELGITTLKIFDLLGNEISTLMEEEKMSGKYNVEFDGKNLASGTYFYQLRSGSFVLTKKMQHIK